MRKSRNANGPVFAFGIMFLLCLALMATLPKTDKQIADMQALQKSGVQTTGYVVDRQTSGSKTTTYWLKYTYFAAGQSYKDRFSVSRSEYLASHGGQPITISYLPTNPEISSPNPVAQERKAHTNKFVAWTMLLVSAVAFAIAISRARRANVRLRAGRSWS